ncbi:hypothetical protein MTO96_015743 [Rhipicephalus appendiculatus]
MAARRGQQRRQRCLHSGNPKRGQGLPARPFIGALQNLLAHSPFAPFYPLPPSLVLGSAAIDLFLGGSVDNGASSNQALIPLRTPPSRREGSGKGSKKGVTGRESDVLPLVEGTDEGGEGVEGRSGTFCDYVVGVDRESKDGG